MKKWLASLALILMYAGAGAQLSVRYDSSLQPTTQMQYFKPVGNNLFVGDCIPFYHQGTYYLYWLIDSAHHSALNGLGGHQWVLSTSKDLRNWVNHPIVLGIDEEWEKSICTGSVVVYKNRFYAFYATRLIVDGKVNEQLSYAISTDGIHFVKQKPNPFYTSAPGYSQRNFRDPKVFVDAAGTFHLFVSSETDSAPMKHFRGALVHLSSDDLKSWKVNAPVLTGQRSVPECPDYFLWNKWYYLVYSDNSDTWYVKSRNPYGPWEEPRYQALVESWANVVKTAEFTGGRRIAAAWIPNHLNNKDNEREIFGGNTVFREVKQEADGTLSTKFPKEMIPATGKPQTMTLIADSTTTKGNGEFSISAPGATGAAHFANMPANARITLQIVPKTALENYGLEMKSDEAADNGYRLNFSPSAQTVELGNTRISAVTGLDKPVTLDIVIKDDIIDVSIDGRRCIVNRVSEHNGSNLWFYAKNGSVTFKNVVVAPLVKP